MPRITHKDHSNYNQFGVYVISILHPAGVTNEALATALNVSPAAINYVFTGKNRASPQWAEAIANAIEANAEMRRNLHLAAARSVGYQIWEYTDRPDPDAPEPSSTGRVAPPP